MEPPRPQPGIRGTERLHVQRTRGQSPPQACSPASGGQRQAVHPRQDWTGLDSPWVPGLGLLHASPNAHCTWQAADTSLTNGGSVVSLLTRGGRPGDPERREELLPAEDLFPRANHLRTRCNFPPLLPRRLDSTSALRTRVPGMPGGPVHTLYANLYSNTLTLKTNGDDTAPPQRAFQKALGVTRRTKDPQPQPASQRGCSHHAPLCTDDRGRLLAAR